jgi:GntR family transcriptional regulator
VLARLEEAITDGIFGEVLPSEHELARQLGVSRPTVRSALRSLEDQGLISRQRGVGTRVNTSVSRIRLNLDRVIGFWNLIEDAGHTPSLAHTKLIAGRTEAHVASRLHCDVDEPLAVIDRLFLADGEPAIAVQEMVLETMLERRVDATEIPSSIFEFAAVHMGTPIDYTIVEIMPEVADTAAAELLGLKVGSPLLRLLETHYGNDGRVLMFSDIRVVDRFVRFNIVRRARGQ